MALKLTILGCGTSAGVPRIGNDWGDCDPNEPKNRRSRVSILVESPATRILVDTSPDLRNQFLDNDIDRIDAVIWTHDHADHCHGIDDLRAVFQQRRQPIPAYARPFALASLQNRFAYAFEGHKYYPSICEAMTMDGDLEIGDISVRLVDQPHGGITSAGLRFEYQGKSIVYATDFGEVTEDMRALYRGCDLLVVDALRDEPHPTHAHLDMTLDLIDDVRPELSLLTHMDKSMDYHHLVSILPDHVRPAYDGYVKEI
ncbi:MBL fold metallo-hydrolase [Sphingorhabdus sp. YGSMI21]|uniref:MBL fold metallo-hydrolase n=1 Tax=Sphingorhabdus sp. YGSMI21 TaxID=2077182 RepID=UPI000C1E4CE7|nr:MBL fold metallo-hydrolase [Sphingorhabdus sp. YGSMI21]ATW04696.1 MBL fold metallo-hydrolase [Sphingorhabdus sp. YGSMI21]